LRIWKTKKKDLTRTHEKNSNSLLPQAILKNKVPFEIAQKVGKPRERFALSSSVFIRSLWFSFCPLFRAANSPYQFSRKRRERKSQSANFLASSFNPGKVDWQKRLGRDRIGQIPWLERWDSSCFHACKGVGIDRTGSRWLLDAMSRTHMEMFAWVWFNWDELLHYLLTSPGIPFWPQYPPLGYLTDLSAGLNTFSPRVMHWAPHVWENPYHHWCRIDPALRSPSTKMRAGRGLRSVGSEQLGLSSKGWRKLSKRKGWWITCRAFRE